MTDGGKVERLRSPLMHLGYRSIGDYVERLNRYTDLAATTLEEQGVALSRTRLFFSPPATFVKLYLLRLGFLDGVRGLVVAAAAEPTPEDPDPGAS